MLLRQTGDEVGVTRRDALLDECLGDIGDELQQRETGVDVACALAGFGDKRGDIVAGKVLETLKALRLFIRMDIDTL